MGDYINYQDVAARHRIFDTSSMSNVSSDMIYYAEREVEAVLASTFTVPFGAAHPTIKDLCISMVYARYMQIKNPKTGEYLYKSVRKRIENIRDGKEFIITGSGSMMSVVSDYDLPGSSNEDYHPIHSLLDAEDNIIDSDLLDDLEDEREND